jgi:acyl-coenzyme A thioesterase PaaI-like protein
MTTRQLQKQLRELRSYEHPHCIVCGSGNRSGLRLDFRPSADGCIEARFSCNHVFQGYTGLLHGGLISSVLDGAMTNYLFARGKVAFTAELTVRFIHPVATDRMALVRAWSMSSSHGLHILGAEVIQDGQTAARATGKLIEQKQCMSSTKVDRLSQKGRTHYA